MMYIPRKSLLNLNDEKTFRTSRLRNPLKRHGVAFASVMLVLLLLAAMMLQKTESKEQSAAPARYAHDLQQLWSWSDSVMAGGAESAEWTFRIDTVLSAGKTLDQLSDMVFTDRVGGIPSERIVTNGGLSVSGQFPVQLGGNADAARLSLHQTGQADTDNGIPAMLLLESGVGGATVQGLQAALRQLGSVLADLTEEWTLTMKTHGFTNKQEGAKTVERIAMGRVVEQYEDGGTRSVTMISDALLSSMALDRNRHANLQVAEHRSTETELNELTIGVPLITGDFSSTQGTAELKE